ncbi:MAG TPA: hypothetical protein D7I06_01735 [Candidatus Poseidoniales archaeon]|nr:MAG TPA: hypothetical protein D7I06_01735 [Candidatus Poseidoniales archaeon]
MVVRDTFNKNCRIITWFLNDENKPILICIQ